MPTAAAVAAGEFQKEETHCIWTFLLAPDSKFLSTLIGSFA
jgi:hypothetical protein